MNKNYYSDTMRSVRVFRAKMEEAYKEHHNAIARIVSLRDSGEYGNTRYNREIDEVNNAFAARQKALSEEARRDLTPLFTNMREIAKQRIVKAPTPEIASTLQILATLDKITPTQITLYAEQMSDCPIAMQALSQIAMKHNQHILIDEPERRLEQLAAFEANIASFLQNYNGTEENALFSVRKMIPYFQGEDKLMSIGGTEKVDRLFWTEFVGAGSPDCYNDPNAPAGKPKAQYFFEDVDGLLAFISSETKGKSGEAIEKTINEVLANCPEQYGAAYRNYKACGEKIALNGEPIEE